VEAGWASANEGHRRGEAGAAADRVLWAYSEGKLFPAVLHLGPLASVESNSRTAAAFAFLTKNCIPNCIVDSCSWAENSLAHVLSPREAQSPFISRINHLPQFLKSFILPSCRVIASFKDNFVFLFFIHFMTKLYMI